MRKTLLAFVLVIVAASSSGASLISAQQFRNDFRADSVIANAASALQVIQNGTNDYSLKIISGDGTKNVTIIRFVGTSAWSDIQVVYTLFKMQGEVLGLEW